MLKDYARFTFYKRTVNGQPLLHIVACKYDKEQKVNEKFIQDTSFPTRGHFRVQSGDEVNAEFVLFDFSKENGRFVVQELWRAVRLWAASSSVPVCPDCIARFYGAQE